MKNKKGWIMIVEAFVAILLIGAVLVVILNQQNSKTNDPTSSVGNYENYILRTIELNDSMRGELINIDNSNLPVNWSTSNFPSDIEKTITNLTLNSLVCQAQICLTNDTCKFESKVDKDVYVQSIFITATDSNYNPRQLKLFCWTKQ
jgi:hypothetical protein